MRLIGTYVNPFSVWPSAPFLVHVCCVWLPFFNGIAPSTHSLAHSLAHSLSHSLSQSVTRARNFRTRDMNMKGAPSHNNGKTRMLPAVNGPKTTESRAATSQFGAPPPSKQTSDGGISDGSRNCVIIGVLVRRVWFTADWLQTSEDICSGKKRNFKKKEVDSEGERLIHNFLHLAQIFLCV